MQDTHGASLRLLERGHLAGVHPDATGVHHDFGAAIEVDDADAVVSEAPTPDIV
jgi:hypothetical protein